MSNQAASSQLFSPLISPLPSSPSLFLFPFFLYFFFKDSTGARIRVDKIVLEWTQIAERHNRCFSFLSRNIKHYNEERVSTEADRAAAPILSPYHGWSPRSLPASKVSLAFFSYTVLRTLFCGKGMSCLHHLKKAFRSPIPQTFIEWIIPFSYQKRCFTTYFWPSTRSNIGER